MKHLKTFNEAMLPIQSDGRGEYTTEEFDKFMRELIDTIEWSGDDTPRWKKVQFNMPSLRDRNASSISQSKEEAIQNWENALEARSNDKNTLWYVWHAEVGGSMNKPAKFTAQRFDIDSIMAIARKYPDAVRRINVTADSDQQKDFGKMMTRDYYNGKSGNYTGD